MNILTVCSQGNNRSVTLAHLLRYKYPDADVIPAGVHTLSKTTLNMLFKWADVVALTDSSLSGDVPTTKTVLFDVGEDKYPRPFNKELLRICKLLIEENPL